MRCDVVPLSTPKKDLFQNQAQTEIKLAPGRELQAGTGTGAATGTLRGGVALSVQGPRALSSPGLAAGSLILGHEALTGLLVDSVPSTLAGAGWGFLGSQSEISCKLHVHVRAVDFEWP